MIWGVRVCRWVGAWGATFFEIKLIAEIESYEKRRCLEEGENLIMFKGCTIVFVNFIVCNIVFV